LQLNFFQKYHLWDYLYDNINIVPDKKQQDFENMFENILTNVCSDDNITLQNKNRCSQRDKQYILKELCEEEDIMNTGRRDVIKKRRVNLLRRRIVIVGVTCIAMFLICATFVNLYNVNANNTSKNPLYKYYTSYQIEPGDTLTSIAQKYTINSDVSVQDYIDEVKKNNNLVSDKINSGSYLVVSYYSNEYK
jgi:hypothetical protein